MKIDAISEPKIVKLNLDLEQGIKQGERLSVQFTGGVMVPKNDSDEVCYASMNLLMKTNADKIIISLMMRSKVICPLKKNETISRENLIKKEAFPLLIEKLKELYNQLDAAAILKLPDLPNVKFDE